MPADLVRRKVEQGPVLVGDVLVLVSEIYLHAIVASHLSHSIVALHWKTTDARNTCTPVSRPGQLTRISNARRVRLCRFARLPYRFFGAATATCQQRSDTNHQSILVSSRDRRDERNRRSLTSPWSRVQRERNTRPRVVHNKTTRSSHLCTSCS